MPKYPYRILGSFFDRIFRNALNDNFKDVETDLLEQKGRVDNLIINTPQPSEVVDARGTFPVLRDRLDNVNAQMAQKANRSYVDTQLENIGDGSPKGVYSTLSALESAYPTGTTGIYVVQADGHWYYWNGSAWSDGGVYQSTGSSEFPAKNLVKNGNFSLDSNADGLADNFTRYAGVTYSLANNVQTFTPTVVGNVLKYSLSNLPNTKIYVSLFIHVPVGKIRVYGFSAGHIIAENTTDFTHFSTVLDGSSSNVGIYFQDFNETLNNPVNIKYLTVINLTETFGSGSEPTKEEMDNMMSDIPNRWFEGTKAPFLDNRKIQSSVSGIKTDLTLTSGIKGTTQAVLKNPDGSIQKVNHFTPDNVIVRTDEFTFETNKITEVRTLLASGEKLTLIYHLDTLQTEVI